VEEQVFMPAFRNSRTKRPLVPLCGISPGVRGYMNSGSAIV
jgi:hypothetical protein